MPRHKDTVAYRDIPGLVGYRVGDDGSVWTRWARVSRSGPGSSRGFDSILSNDWRRLAGSVCHGRRTVGLKVGRRKYRLFLVHRLVLLAFVGPCPPGMECRHFPDRNPLNCRLDNLQWGTRKENAADMKVHETDNAGERNPRALLTEKDVRRIRKRYDSGKATIAALTREYGMSEGAISWIVHRRSWKQVA